MSRTRHGSKAPGYEYWGRRPCKLPYPDPGRDAKRFTRRAERLQDHAAERAALREARMSDDKPDPLKITALDFATWTLTLAEPLPYEDAMGLRAEIEAERTTLTEREKALLALAGMMIANMAHEAARRMFERQVPAIIASIARDMRDDDDDEPEGGSKPS